MTTSLMLTCEHAGNRVPAGWRALFRGARQVLESHRGWDPGALALAKTFRDRLPAQLFYTTVTRLLVEPNRSIGHRRLFSEFTAGLDGLAKQMILQRHYHPHRDRVEAWIGQRVDKRLRVIHLSVHTFTPQLNGRTRNADVGLLYDPNRRAEKDLCARWKAAIQSRQPDLRVRCNYPYLGKADGFTTHLRRRFPRYRYVGIELEVNQRWVGKTAAWNRLKRTLVESLRDVLPRDTVTRD